MTRHHLALVVGGNANGESLCADAEPVAAGPLDSGAHTLRLLGALSHGSAHFFEAELERLCASGIDALIIDLSGLDSIDWSGTRVIAFRCGWCSRRGCDLVLIPGPAHIQSVFANAGLSARLPFRPLAPGAATASSREPELASLTLQSAQAHGHRLVTGRGPRRSARERGRRRR